MIKKFLKRNLLFIFFVLSLGLTFVQGDEVQFDPGVSTASSSSEPNDSFTLIPADTTNEWEKAVENLINSPDGSFVGKYKNKAGELNVAAQLNSWIVNFSGITGLLVHIVKLLLDAAMVIGFLMIIYSGYIYATGVFTGNVTKWNNAIKNAVIGLLIVIFSYTIIKILTAMFL